MGMPDSVVAWTSFRSGSRFLGAEQVHVLPASGKGWHLAARMLAAWAYDCQVAVFVHRSFEGARASVMANDGRRRVVITDAEAFASLPGLVDAIPGALHSLQDASWDAVVLNAEWETNSDGVETYELSSPVRVPNTKYAGFVVNCSAECGEGVGLDDVLGKFESGRVFVTSLKSSFPAKMAAVFGCMQKLQGACDQLTGGSFTPRFDRDRDEWTDGLFKGFLNAQIAFELQTEENGGAGGGRFMYRSWANNSINCECRFAVSLEGTSVEMLRVFDNGCVLHDIANQVVAV